MNILVRGLDPATVERLDAEAASRGLSRNEFLKRKLEGPETAPVRRKITAEDWARSREAFADLANEEIMKGAWQ